MKLVIRREAVDDLDAIYDWIARDSKDSAARVVRALRARMVDERRETITIVAIVHGARER